jgi:putative oxidoreductase
MKYFVPLGRILFAFIFVMSSFGHFTGRTVGYAAKQGMPLAEIAVPLSGVLALLGGLSVALGFKAKWGAWLLVLFLVPVTAMLHNFWAVSDPAMRQMQQINFYKNAAMLGAALMITYFGSGPCSIDNLLAKRRKGATAAGAELTSEKV